MARNLGGEQEDRMSALPDDILLDILSFLPMYEVVRTSILSRRWRHLWTKVPVLDFSTHDPPFNHWNYIELFINNCLMLYNAPKIKKFHARVNCICIDYRILGAWLGFALHHDVEELDMDYMAAYWDVGIQDIFFYLMPECLSQFGALRTLRLRVCALKLPASYCLGSLRTLELYHVLILSELNTSGCPLLESLLLHGCNSRRQLSICSPNQKLQMLKIYDMYDVVWAPSDLIIDAPYLLSIEISGYMRKLGCYIKNLSSVTSASLDFTCMFGTEYCFQGKMLVKLLGSLRHVKTLKLCPWCIQDIYLEDAILGNSPFSTTCLALGTSLSKDEIRGMIRLLDLSHYLETLIVDIQMVFSEGIRDIAGSVSWETLECVMSSLLHLKTVRIYNLFCTDIASFSGETTIIIDKILKDREEEIELLKVVLKSCEMLDKMFINIINTKDPTKWMLVVQLFLSLTEELKKFPWASANAEVYLS